MGFNVGAFICGLEAWAFVLRMLSMEKLRFLACCAAAAGRVTSEAASSRSVGVRGGEASEDTERGEAEAALEEAGDTQPRSCPDTGLSSRSALIWCGPSSPATGSTGR